jgi:hypothetical protein
MTAGRHPTEFFQTVFGIFIGPASDAACDGMDWKRQLCSANL